ncbi:Chaperonin CPN60 [Citrus sinensis]|uniref:Chaperonin CPN60 n=1 Tax=Citrus sinensis TaxID=2711 RepID=A0ACB8MFK5_CITSI|nr:Chaperonin CPN60 [Citrus sinensis]
MMMLPFASGLASKVRLPNNYRLSWRRSFGAYDVSQRPMASELISVSTPDRYVTEETFLPSGGNACFLEQAKNWACNPDEYDGNVIRGSLIDLFAGGKYLPGVRQALCTGGCKVLEAGVDAMDLKNGIYIALEAIEKHLQHRAQTLTRSEEVAQVGRTAANGDREIGDLIAKAMEKVGKDGDFIISDKKKFNNELEFVNNMKLNWGSMSRYFLYEEDQTLNEVKRPLLVVANDVEEEVAGFVVTNETFSKTKLCFVKPPVFEESWKAVYGENCELVYEENCKAIMRDIAILTGGRVVTAASNSLYIPLMLGSCKKVKVTNNEMIIHGGSGNQVYIEDRCEQLSDAIEMSTSDYEIKLLEERLQMLSSRVAILKVGGATTAESRKKRKRATNALNAAKAAMEEGIIPGGGVALLHASEELEKLPAMNIGEKIGVKLLQHAVKMPLYTIASTAGFQVSVVEKLLGQENPDLEYDPPRDEYVDAVKSAIVDPPLKLIRNELDDAVRKAAATEGKSRLIVSRSTTNRLLRWLWLVRKDRGNCGEQNSSGGVTGNWRNNGELKREFCDFSRLRSAAFRMLYGDKDDMEMTGVARASDRYQPWPVELPETETKFGSGSRVGLTRLFL